MNRPQGEDGWLIGGPEARPVEIVAYRADWPARFELERTKIDAALPGTTSIEHIGSTSVPGLWAKPVIDIIVTIDPFDVDRITTNLEAVDYQLRVLEPRHLMFRTPVRDVHIHLWSDPAETQRHLLFRDWLRVNADDRNRYEAVKRELATKPWVDMNDYADAKSSVITEITTRAQAWSASRDLP